jgi:NADH-quinone oxidoreductase subunit L
MRRRWRALTVIAWVGGATALFAALIATQQNDIKRILAYSTVSQLATMVMAVGLAAPVAAMFHLTTHAFFKALLFLGAGSVIHALQQEQDIWRMGGLARRMPMTFWTFLVATLALCGAPPLSGFFSKDAILAAALAERGSLPLFFLATLVAVLTTFYMGRLFLVALLGTTRSEAARHAHESPPVMTAPLLVLALMSLVGGGLGIARVYARHLGEGAGSHAGTAMVASMVAVAIGVALAWLFYRHAAADPLPDWLRGAARTIRNKFYLDELYQRSVIRLHDAAAEAVDWLDRWIVAGFLVRGVSGGTELTGRLLRLLQTGNVQTYAFLLTLGVALLLYFTIGR